MELNNQYVTLTGSKNNAGDYLIKYRAKKLFKHYRKDREIIDLNGWESLDSERLKIVNSSRALILLGGPSIVFDTVPRIYRLMPNIDDITVPIITMGVGWMSDQGRWQDTYDYKLSTPTLQLLKRVNESGYYSSVRDYHTLNVLRFKRLGKFLMTGCPAYYDLDFLGSEIEPKPIKKVAFSLGVSFIHSANMERLMKHNILAIRERFKDLEFEVVFHHALDKKVYKSTYKGNMAHIERHLDFAAWLSANGINYVDISGSAENLMNYYANIDLHIGYRVHAHIFMSSISRYSLLLSEDGRAKGSYGTIGGVVLDAILKMRRGLFFKVLERSIKYDRYTSNLNLTDDIVNNIDYEIQTNWHRVKLSRNAIDKNFHLMREFLSQLP